MSKPVKALLFDLGGVVIDISFDSGLEVWSNYSNVDPSILKSRWSQNKAYEKHERGEITGTEFFKSLRTSLGINLSDEQFIEGWNAIMIGEISPTVRLIKDLKKQMPLYAFSNINTTHFAELTKTYSDAIAPFEEIYCSFKMGMRKPELASYRFVASEMNYSLDEIMFFDDTEPNVLAAKELGMQAVLVTSPDDVLNAVKTFL